VYEMHEGLSQMEVEVNCSTAKLQSMEDMQEILEMLSASWAPTGRLHTQYLECGELSRTIQEDEGSDTLAVNPWYVKMDFPLFKEEDHIGWLSFLLIKTFCFGTILNYYLFQRLKLIGKW
jgi:hypothetical protein